MTAVASPLFDIEAKAFADFERYFNDGDYPHLRYGQAFFNHFSLQKHDAKGEEEILFDRIYNEPNNAKARAMVLSILQFS